MEQAFEKALADARNGETAEDQDVEEIPRDRDADGQGDFEAVWQSLRPEAERLNQLAEWERDFSQVSDFRSSSPVQPLMLYSVCGRRGRSLRHIER